MGNCCLTGGGNANQQQKTVTIADSKDESTTKKISLQGAATDSASKSEPKTVRRHTATKGMTRLTMKFPHIRHSFRECKKVFDAKVGDKDGLQKSEMRALLIQLGADSELLTDDEVSAIFKTANLDGDNDIDFKEFLIAAAVGCFLNEKIDHEAQSADFKKIRKGFLVAREAFDFIDEDDGGSIDFEELRSAFSTMRQDDATVKERLKELDFNEDQEIEFPEFVYGITAWVGMDPDGDDVYINATTAEDNAALNVGNAETPRHRLSSDQNEKLLDENNNPNTDDT